MSDPLSSLLAQQSGVVARAQLLALGETAKSVERRVRRREFTPVMRGVYLDHTGQPTWIQHAWAAVLRHEPAALDGWAALRADLGPGWRRYDARRPIYVAVEHSRRLAPEPGVKIRRVLDLDSRVRWNLGPPRVRVEEAGITVASRIGSDVDAVAVLAELCQGRVTTPERLRTALDERGRIRRRDWMESVLTDLSAGVCSTLEHGYLTRVERPHGLPRGTRQSEDRLFGRLHRRDVDYGIAVVELDGRMFHESSEARDQDLDRDLDLIAARGRPTIRLGYGQVFVRPCRTALRVGAALQRAGWAGRPHPCRLCAATGRTA